MNTIVYKYRVYCSTDSKYEYVWGTTEPTTCPTNTAHTITTSKTTIIDEANPTIVEIKEESIKTGGFFKTDSIKINATANQTSSIIITHPFDITALLVEWISEETHRGDKLSLFVGPLTFGTITANIAPASAWVTQNYVVGNIVTYNSKVYTCTTNTISNEIPTDTIYWQHGFEIPVSQTVIDNVKNGWEITIKDGTNSDVIERIILIDSINNKIYVEKNLTNSFLAATPSYVDTIIYTMKNYEIGAPFKYEIGNSKIGGSHVPANTTIEIDYENLHATENKTFIGYVEYLY